LVVITLYSTKSLVKNQLNFATFRKVMPAGQVGAEIQRNTTLTRDNDVVSDVTVSRCACGQCTSEITDIATYD